MDYFEWESAVIEAVAEVMSISHSDATGFVEAQPFYMQQSWGKNMDAQHAAAKLIKAAQAETETYANCAPLDNRQLDEICRVGSPLQEMT